MNLAEAAAHDAVAMFLAPEQPGPYRLPAYREPPRNGYYGDGALRGEMTADGRHMVLWATGSAHDKKNIAERLHLLTAAGESALDENGQPTGARYYPLSWATIVQLGFIYNHDGQTVWKPWPKLTEWIIAETIRRTSPPPAIPRCWPESFTPYPHQLDGAAAIASAGKYLLGDEPGTGKAQPLDAQVLTPSGFRAMGEIRTGDLVIAGDGTPSRVTGVFPQGEQDCYEVIFSDGSSAECNDQHLWRVSRHRRMLSKTTGERLPYYWQTRTLRDLIDAGLRAPNGDSDRAKWYVPMITAPDLECGAKRELDPYLLGLLLGDGGFTTRSTRVSTADAEIVASIESLVPPGIIVKKEPGKKYDYRLVSTLGSANGRICACGRIAIARGLCGRCYQAAVKDDTRSRFPIAGKRCHPVAGPLADLGLRGCSSLTKFVPDAYKMSPASCRLAVLQGLMDTDGWVLSRDGTAQFGSSSRQLAEDVRWLAESLGGTGHLAARFQLGRERYTVTVNLPQPLSPFRLSRKTCLWKNRHSTRQPARSLVSAEFAGRKPMQCIAIDHPSRLYVTDRFAVTHNTASTLLGIEARRLAGTDVFPMVIVVPSWEVARVWQDHIRELMPHWPEPVLHRGAKRARIASWKHGRYILITTYATMRRDAPDMRGLLVKIRAACVIADESHLGRNPKAKQSKALWRVAHYAATLVWASGTLVTHDFGDIYQPLFTMAPLDWPSKEDLKRRYLATRRGNGDYDELILGLRPEMEAEFFAALAGQLRRVAKADVLAFLPDKIYSLRRPEMPPAWRHAYDTMRDQMLAELPDGGELPVMYTIEKLTRLSQLASSAADVAVDYRLDEATGLLKPHYTVTLKPPCWKAEALLDLLAERPDQPTAVFAESRQLAMITGQYCAKAGLRTGYVVGEGNSGEYGEPGVRVTKKTRQAAVEDFQAGKLDVIICTLGAGGLGITLTASNSAAMLQRSYQLDLAIQPEDRVHRIGAEKWDHVEIVDFVTLDTVDQYRREVLKDKAGQAGQLYKDPRYVRMLLGGLD
jgi:hypothetical protein